MAIRKIVKVGDEILTKKSKIVEVFDKRLVQILEDMTQTMTEAQGVGLAAVQIGILKRIVVINDGEKIIELINPEINKAEGEQVTIEGCLSCPGKFGYTKRPMTVSVKALDRNGNEFTLTGENLLAKAFCHEIDHLDGKLFLDIVIQFVKPEDLE